LSVGSKNFHRSAVEDCVEILREISAKLHSGAFTEPDAKMLLLENYRNSYWLDHARIE
jgi:hypothetical protein